MNFVRKPYPILYEQYSSESDVSSSLNFRKLVFKPDPATAYTVWPEEWINIEEVDSEFGSPTPFIHVGDEKDVLDFSNFSLLQKKQRAHDWLYGHGEEDRYLYLMSYFRTLGRNAMRTEAFLTHINQTYVDMMALLTSVEIFNFIQDWKSRTIPSSFSEQLSYILSVYYYPLLNHAGYQRVLEPYLEQRQKKED